eukprot:scaffold594_cov71-Skeletonema_dohrnii-CCMP3373.AAC.6
MDHLVCKYIYRQSKDRPWEQRNDPIMVGDLPLKRKNYFFRALDWLDDEPPPPEPERPCTNYATAIALEHLQVLLHLEGQETEAVILGGGRSSLYDSGRTPFLEAIRANWEQFSRAQADNQLEDFTISDMTLPPAPFFRNHIVPILQNDTLMRLDLIDCELGSSELQGVAEILKKCPTLTSLCLKQNQIENVDDATVLSSAMAKHKGLFFVDLSSCGLGRNDEILSVILKGCKKLNGLDLSGNEFGSKSLAIIAKFLSTHKTITILNLGGSGFDDESVTSLNKAVEKNKTLTELSLASTKITLSTSIQRSLVLNDKLLHIDLSKNSLGANGAKYIAKHLKKNPPLSILSLRRCSLPNKSAEGLCNALKRNTNLAHLDLNYNNFNDRSVPFFADALRNNSTLLSFHMSGNNIKVKSGRKDLIQLALCDPTSLQSIAESNHTCLVTLNSGKNGNFHTNEDKFRSINALENEGQKIRYKVIAALFTLKTIEFNPREFQHIPLELMPRLLELVQLEMGYGKYGRGVWKAPVRAKGSNPRLARVYEVIRGWSMMPSLFARGPGKRKKKAAKKRKHAFAFKEADDEEWKPKSRY